MTDILGVSVNYFAVFVGAVASFIVGWLWYGPLFGTQWRALMGFTNESMKSMKITPQKAMLGGLISSLVLAYVYAHDVFVWGDFFGASVGSAAFAFQLALWIWLGYFVTNTAGAWLWEGKPFKLVLLNIGYQFVSLFLMALVLVFWK